MVPKPFTSTWMLNQEHTPKHAKQICLLVGGQVLN
jgi:hypothetical protein